MARRNARLLALLLVCAAVGACVVNLSFDMDQRGLEMVAPGAGTISQSRLVDLGTYDDIQIGRASCRERV